MSSLTKHYVLIPVSLPTPALTKCQHLDISIPSTEKSEFLFKITQFVKAVATTMNQNKQTNKTKQTKRSKTIKPSSNLRRFPLLPPHDRHHFSFLNPHKP